MASLVRPHYTAVDKATGRKVKKRAKCWYGQYVDADGTRKRVKLTPNKAAAQQMLAELVKRAELAKGGYVDPFAAHRGRPLAELLTEYEAHHAAKGNTAKQAGSATARIRTVCDGAGFARLADLDAAAAETYLTSRRGRPRRDGGIGLQTFNHYVAGLKAFGNWLVKARRAAENPFRHLSKVNVAVDIRHRRRDLSADEFDALTAAARSGRVYRRLSGPDRAVLYVVAGHTGLRASELASLTPGSFALDATPPTVTVAAAYSKHRREDVVPLHPNLVALLRPWVAARPAAAPLWPGKWAKHNEAVDLIKRDLGNARSAWIVAATDPAERERRELSDFLTYRDSRGHVADYHSLRHTFVTNLVRSDVLPKDAKELARHPTISLTMDRYSHVGLADTAAAVGRLTVSGQGGPPPACTPACTTLAPTADGVGCQGTAREV